MVARGGLEPPTYGLWFRCSNQLSYPTTGKNKSESLFYKPICFLSNVKFKINNNWESIHKSLEFEQSHFLKDFVLMAFDDVVPRDYHPAGAFRFLFVSFQGEFIVLAFESPLLEVLAIKEWSLCILFWIDFWFSFWFLSIKVLLNRSS